MTDDRRKIGRTWVDLHEPDELQHDSPRPPTHHYAFMLELLREALDELDRRDREDEDRGLEARFYNCD